MMLTRVALYYFFICCVFSIPLIHSLLEQSEEPSALGAVEPPLIQKNVSEATVDLNLLNESPLFHTSKSTSDLQTDPIESWNTVEGTNSNSYFESNEATTSIAVDHYIFNDSAETERSFGESSQLNKSPFEREIERLKKDCGINVNVSESRLWRLLSQIDHLEIIEYPLLSTFGAFLKLRRRDMKANTTRECFKSLVSRIDGAMTKLEQSIDIPKRLFLFDHSLKNLRDSLQVIQRSLLFPGTSYAKITTRSRCETQNPTDMLDDLFNKTAKEPKLFAELVINSEFNEELFNERMSALQFLAGLSALLGVKCDKLLHRNVSTPQRNHILHEYFKRGVQSKLISINEEVISARSYLRRNFSDASVLDIQQALKQAIINGYSNQRAADFIHGQLSSKYSFRAWSITLYDRVRLQATATHFHEGTGGNWHYIQSDHHTIIAHSADRQTNCSQFANLFATKKIHDLFATEDEYQSFFKPSDHLGTSTSQMKELLSDKLLPQNYFFSVILYRSDLAVALEKEYHHFEHLRDPGTRDFGKTVVIGWC